MSREELGWTLIVGWEKFHGKLLCDYANVVMEKVLDFVTKLGLCKLSSQLKYLIKLSFNWPTIRDVDQLI